MAGKALEHDRARGVAVAEAAGELRRIERVAAEHAQEAELAFEHAHRSGKAVGRQARGEHAAFGRAPEMETLDHGAGARAGELHQPAGERAGNAERVAHMLGVEAHQSPAGDRRAERAGRAGRVEAAALVAVMGRAPDADHDLGARDEGGDQLAAADAALLRHGKAGREQGRARMHAGARPGEIVHLEGMRETAVGQGGGWRMHPCAAGSENAALAAGAVLLRKGDDDPAPRQIITVDDGGDRVGDALLGALDHVGREIVVPTGRRVVRDLHRLFRHLQTYLGPWRTLLPSEREWIGARPS